MKFIYEKDWKAISYNDSIFPKLEEIFQENEREQVKKTLFVCVQHTLLTTMWQYRLLMDLGGTVFSLDKIYSRSDAGEDELNALHANLRYKDQLHYFRNSENREMALDDEFSEIFNDDLERMLQNVKEHLKNHQEIKHIVFLDDGGRLHEKVLAILEKEETERRQTGGNVTRLIDYKLAFVEQTSKGTQTMIDNYKKSLPIPYIMNSASLIKQFISPYIADGDWRAISPILETANHPTVGIIGAGKIGKALNTLLEKNLMSCETRFYDQSFFASKKLKPEQKSNIIDIIKNSDFVFGATGQNWTKQFMDISEDEENEIITALQDRKSPVTFISASSERIEFKAFMKYLYDRAKDPHDKAIELTCYDETDPLADIKFQVGTCEVIFYRGGFPANFSPIERMNNLVSAFPQDLQCTRGGLTAAMAICGPNIARRYNEQSGACNFLKLSPILQQFLAKETLQTNPYWCQYSSYETIKKLNGFYSIAEESFFIHQKESKDTAIGVDFGCDVRVMEPQQICDATFFRSTLLYDTDSKQWLWVDICDDENHNRVYSFASHNLPTMLTINGEAVEIELYDNNSADDIPSDKKNYILSDLFKKVPHGLDRGIRSSCKKELKKLTIPLTQLEAKWQKEHDVVKNRYQDLWNDNAIDVANIFSQERLARLHSMDSLHEKIKSYAFSVALSSKEDVVKPAKDVIFLLDRLHRDYTDVLAHDDTSPGFWQDRLAIQFHQIKFELIGNLFRCGSKLNMRYFLNEVHSYFMAFQARLAFLSPYDSRSYHKISRRMLLDLTVAEIHKQIFLINEALKTLYPTREIPGVVYAYQRRDIVRPDSLMRQYLCDEKRIPNVFNATSSSIDAKITPKQFWTIYSCDDILLSYTWFWRKLCKSNDIENCSNEVENIVLEEKDKILNEEQLPSEFSDKLESQLNFADDRLFSKEIFIDPLSRIFIESLKFSIAYQIICNTVERFNIKPEKQKYTAFAVQGLIILYKLFPGIISSSEGAFSVNYKKASTLFLPLAISFLIPRRSPCISRKERLKTIIKDLGILLILGYIFTLYDIYHFNWKLALLKGARNSSQHFTSYAGDKIGSGCVNTFWKRAPQTGKQKRGVTDAIKKYLTPFTRHH